VQNLLSSRTASVAPCCDMSSQKAFVKSCLSNRVPYVLGYWTCAAACTLSMQIFSNRDTGGLPSEPAWICCCSNKQKHVVELCKWMPNAISLKKATTTSTMRIKTHTREQMWEWHCA
jgi:hypothetical protein